MTSIQRYCLAFLAVYLIAAAGLLREWSAFTSWYATILHPSFAAPGALIEPAWFLLYLCMALALGRVWSDDPGVRREHWLAAFMVQLCLNLLWSVLFFYYHGLLISFLAAIALWIGIVVLALDSASIDSVSFFLVLPYLALVTYMLIVNGALWWIN